MINKLYKSKDCSIIVEVVNKCASKETLTCQGSSMEEIKENTDPTVIKAHLPVVDKTSVGVKVKIGEEEHPMTEEHYIEWIEITSDDYVFRKYLKPNDKPEANFDVREDKFVVRAYCNIHGLWILNVNS